MPRTKPKDPVRSRISRPIAFQDATGLETRVLALIAELLAPVAERVVVLEDASAASLIVQTAEIELTSTLAGRVKIAGVFTSDQVGAPVIIVQAWNGDEAEFGIVAFVGQVTSTRTLEVIWASGRIPPRKLRINYIIGST